MRFEKFSLLPFLGSGVIGGLVVFLGLYLTNLNGHFVNNSENLEFTQQVNNPLNLNPRAKVVPFDFTDAAQKAMPVVVHIKASESPQTADRQQNNSNDPWKRFFGEDIFSNPFGNGIKQGSGSGVIISEDGYIVTNNHVVGFADKVEVTLSNNRTYDATIVGKDENTDLAVIKIEATGLPTLEYANSDKAEVGEWVLAVGNPFDLTSTVTAGIISAKGRGLDIINSTQKIEAFIQTDAAVNPGNSGGALIDAAGNLLGINTAIATNTGSFAGYSFAIPMNLVTKIARDLIEYGSYKRAFIGIQIWDMDNELAQELGIDITQGVYIKDLIEGGAAQNAGLMPKDVITAVNGKSIKSVPELQEIVGRAKVGDSIQVSVIRAGHPKDIVVRLQES